MTTTARSETPFLSTLAGHYYYDPAIYQREQERIFADMWVCAGRADALPDPGSYQLVSLGGESIIVVRSREGKLHAFLNVCRHRGARLCTEAAGQLKGSIQCRYHAWTYGLDGRLIGAPNVLNEEQFDRAAFGLIPVSLEVWEGLTWLNLSERPSDLQTQVNGPLSERFGSYAPFANYHLGDLKLGKSISYDVAANWKLILENFSECYHCGPMHPEFCQLLPGFKTGGIYVAGDSATLVESAEAFSMSGKASRPPLPDLSPDQLRSYYGIIIYPNVLLNFIPDHIVMHTVYPLGPDRSRVVCDWLFDASEVAKPAFDPTDAVEIFDLVNRQDWEVCELTQLGMSSRAYRSGGVYVPVESHIREFADFILDRLS